MNLHFHTLLFDGVFFEGPEGALEFRSLPHPTDDEVGVVLTRIATRVRRLLKRRGLDPGDPDSFHADPMVEESPALAVLSTASIQGRVALGRRAGARVWRVGEDSDAPWVLSGGPRHAHIAGIDLHANVAVPAADRARLEQLCRYLLRPAVAGSPAPAGRWPRRAHAEDGLGRRHAPSRLRAAGAAREAGRHHTDAPIKLHHVRISRPSG